jgi:serine/threonine protein phosphatase PrpC
VLKESNTDSPCSPLERKGEHYRRRLSVADVNGTGILDNSDNRGLIQELDVRSLIDLCHQPGGNRGRGSRRFSIGTSTDHDMHRRGSFCDKSFMTSGHSFDTVECGIGFACKKGLKPVSPNQDSFLVLRIEGYVSIYGVFDGHGRQGHDVSDFVKEYLPKLIVHNEAFRAGNIHDALLNGFGQIQDLLQEETDKGNIDATASGTTCTIVVHRGKKLWVANVGDSRCVLCAPCPHTGEFVATDACRDHKPEIPEEKERIHRSGGIVIKPPMDVNHRVYVKGFRFPGLAMSRALGDLVGYHRAGISAVPEVSEFDLTGNEHLLLCSDGVWEFLSSQDAVSAIETELHSASASQHMDAAEKLCKLSWDKWMMEENGAVVDDITAIVVKLGMAMAASADAVPIRRSARLTPVKPQNTTPNTPLSSH